MSLSQEEKLYIEMLREQVAAQAKRIDEMRAVKHDMYAHMMVLCHYLNIEDLGKARGYLEKIMNISVFRQKIYTDVGNDMVNALLSARVYASKDGITLSTSGLLPDKLWIDDMDLCILFSNLISNSVEACERLTYREKEISLIIKESESFLSVTMINPVEEEIDVKEFGKRTSKEDVRNHGIGFKNIIGIAEKYHGTVDVKCCDGLVLVKIDLPYIVGGTSL